MEIKNGIIKGTHLGRLSHGMMQFYIDLSYGNGSAQIFGGYALDDFDKLKDERVGTAFGLEAIIQVLEVLNVDEWEHLIGTPVRVKIEKGLIKSIGHYLDDNWLNLEELSKEFYD